eukprot:TRINITY_DN50193_c0_g1_i1.p1 TRINITY_DN50193_c0_g1~~TRINITY_DN50193_c0_g1_i1.p1  ORF type:complete len:197 (+),score=31.74 TRINITY_DN50193_c0_g1_i1:86-676(+)
MGASVSQALVPCTSDKTCEQACMEAVEFIPRRHHSEQYEDRMANTVLLRGAMDSDHELMKEQLEKGAQVDTRRPFYMCKLANAEKVDKAKAAGLTPLMYCANAGHLEGVALLLEKGASVNAEDEDSMRPLHFAASSGCRRCCELLLERRADPAAVDDDGRTALSLVPADLCSTKADMEMWTFLLHPSSSPEAFPQS